MTMKHNLLRILYIGVVISALAFIPGVSAGQGILYVPYPDSHITTGDNYDLASSMIDQKSGMSSTFKVTSGIPASPTIGTFPDQNAASVYLSEEEAIQIAVGTFSDISLTADPSATLTPQRSPLCSLHRYPSVKADPVWVVEVSGVSTDPNAFGSLWYRNSQTGEMIFVPTHEGGWVTIDAITGEVISADRCM